MRKILFIAFVFWTSFVQSQTTQTVYQDVQHGDTLFMVKITNTGALDSVTRYSYSSHFIADSLVYDTIPYKYYFFNVTNTVKDSVQMNKLAIQPPLQSGVNIKTINSASPLGSGNITIAGAAEWGSVTGTLADQTDLLDALSEKQNSLGFTAVPDTRTVNGQALTSDVSLSQSDIGLNNVDNTSDANKPVSSATQTALNGKQATLVSGTNIKTINGSTILGSGDLVVSGSGAPTFINLASLFSSTSTTPAVITGWSFAVTSGKTYRITVIADYQTAATTTGGKLGVSLTTATGTVRGFANGSVSQSAVATELKIPIIATSGTGSTLTTSGVSVANSPHYIGLDITFTCTGTGTFNIVWGTEVASSAAQLNANSSLIYQALN